MGTLHGITQISPSFVYEGAALLCKKKFADKVKAITKKIKKESYLDLQESQIELNIVNPNINLGNFIDPEKKLYIIIKSGGKWGYGDSFIELIYELASFLEDAIFYLDHEWGTVEEFKIKNGKLYHSIVAEDTDNFSYIKKAYSKDKTILLQMYQSYLLELYDDLWENNEKEAMQLADKTIKLDPKNWKSYRLKGFICNKMGKHIDAIDCFNQALKWFPDLGEISVTIKKGKMPLDTEDIYIGTAKKALQYNPIEVESYWFEDAEKQLVLDYKNIYTNLGWTYKMLKQYDEALLHYLKAEKIVPNYHHNTPLRYLSDYFIEINEYDKAIEYCEKLISKASSVTDIACAYYNKACIYAKQNIIEKAIYFLTIAIDIHPHKYKNHAKTDEDLKNIHELKAFQELVK